MKKLQFYFLILLFLITGIYLNMSYAYFYNFLSQNKLVSPVSLTAVTVGTRGQAIRYVALGDSLTTGVGVSDIKNSLPYLVAQKLSETNNVTLVNLAHAGDTSSDVLTSQLPGVESYKPDLVTLLIGVNDIHNLKSDKEFEENLIQIVSSLKKSGAKIYLLSIPYLGSKRTVFFPYNFILDFRTKQFNNIIKKAAADFGTNYIDLYHLNKSADFYSSDQFHPSEEGYKEWAKAINVN